MINYDKKEVKEQLELDNIFQLLQEFGGDPEYTSFGILSSTICHNAPGEGSRKLYFYQNSGLFICYTGCEEPRFDIFELVRKVSEIQWHETMDLNAAIRWVARRFGIAGTTEDDKKEEQLEDWKIFSNYDRIKEISIGENNSSITLKEYDDSILNNLNYRVKLTPWINDNISQEVIEKARIGYYFGEEQITIPHFDLNGRFIGLRGRSMIKEEAERYGKYRPVRINKIQYTHPLGLNLYGLNWNKNNIKLMRKAIIFESEKSVLQYASWFGWDNNISVACCGSSISSYQMQLLMNCGAEEIIVAFDRQFQEPNDKEFRHLTRNLQKIHDRYNTFVNTSFIFDKNMITNYKASPIDEGPEKFLQLFKERVVI